MLQTQTYTTKDIEKGIVLIFNAPGNSIVNADEYFYYFDVANIIPKIPEPIITFDPPAASYSMIADKNFKPKIAISVKTLHSSECQILCRLLIKDRYARILYTDYILVITSPPSTVSFNATLKASNVPGNIGPDGGSILILNTTDSLSEIVTGMTVSGPGIPTTTAVTIKSFIDQNKVELSQLVPNNTDKTGSFTFVKQTRCVDPELLSKRQETPSYIVLNKQNNWTYSYNDKTIVEFVREDLNNDSIVVFLPNKNIGLFPNNEQSSFLPQGPIVKAGGRVIGDSQCLSEINFV